MNATLTLANSAAALCSGLFSVAGALRPALPLGRGEQVTPAVDFYARAYAARALPLSLVALVMLTGGAGTTGAAAILIVLGAAQLGDLAIGAQRRIAGMAVCSGLGAVLHLATAYWLLG
ncbi:hypothetical protein [Streptomyces sp. NPDC050738]|uniref:hypothetical protein n=1 Tax=Streptomyces sp. NPDC050738 TaxID=3154744 RepID=UPI00341CEA25